LKKTTVRRGHSEEHFSPDRLHWFNPDFLDLMVKRWQLHKYHSLLDVGAGLCHWSQLLVPYMAENRQVVAFDRDEKWAQGTDASRRFFEKQGAIIDFIRGDAQNLPFPDNSFDVVTCQTVLIHVRNPDLVLREMKRVVKPDGIVICSEPNNRIQTLLQDTSNQYENTEETLNRVKYNLYVEKHKETAQNGNSSFGDLLAGTMNRLGFKHIQSYLNDKLVCIYPPYDTVEQQQKINTYFKWGRSEAEIERFEMEYAVAIEDNSYPNFLKNIPTLTNSNKVIEDLKNQTYANGGAALLYLISGKK
jgi:ubiquinone/menaquinone biosynthesis C-methylase UbiE